MSGDVETDTARVLNAATIGRLAAAIPAPPVVAPLLITTNVRGANVQINGEPAGQAPIRAVGIAPGEHTITVSAAGFASFNRRITVTPAGARVNALLEPTAENASALAADDDATAFTSASSGDAITGEWWFWAAIGGGVVVVAAIVAAIAVSSGGDDGPTIVGIPAFPGSP